MTNTFKIKTLRTINSPADTSITTYMALVNFRDLPSNLSLEVNPRKPKMNTSVAKQLISAVKANYNINFDINNRGIVIIAKSVHFNTSTSELTVDFDDDPSKYGILDGGHTYTAIIEHRNNLSQEIDKYVRLEIIVGNDLDAKALADARNTSAQVSDIALFELDDKFDFIKKSVETQPYKDDIAFKDNENKPIPVVELLKLMFIFNIKRYPDDSSAPTPAYSAKASVFKDFKKELETNNNIYVKLAPQLTKLVELYETIQKEMPKKYNDFKAENGSKGSFGKVRGVTSSQENKTKFYSDFTHSEIPYEISAGFLLPIFGAFRALLKENNNGELYWLFDPIEIWEASGVRLVQNTFETDTNPQMVGKMKTLWQSNYRIVDSVMKDKLIEKLQSQQ
ncbi:AIPR family protein [Gemella sanguinis]|uniref:AIPR family protein n=1 Tax=Gemella sanguinis TaxID=84135 RepID=UPI00352FE0B6